MWLVSDGGNEFLSIVDLEILLVPTVAHSRGVDDRTILSDVAKLLQGEGVADNVLGQCLPALFMTPFQGRRVLG